NPASRTEYIRTAPDYRRLRDVWRNHHQELTYASDPSRCPPPRPVSAGVDSARRSNDVGPGAHALELGPSLCSLYSALSRVCVRLSRGGLCLPESSHSLRR